MAVRDAELRCFCRVLDSGQRGIIKNIFFKSRSSKLVLQSFLIQKSNQYAPAAKRFRLIDLGG